MLIRFVGTEVDADSREREGMFQLAFRLLDEGLIEGADFVELRRHLDWLTRNLDAPRRLSPFRNARRRGRSRRSRRTAIAVSWFKATATEHLERARALARALRDGGFPVEEISALRAGYVTHEDAFQVVGVAFRGDARA